MRPWLLLHYCMLPPLVSRDIYQLALAAAPLQQPPSQRPPSAYSTWLLASSLAHMVTSINCIHLRTVRVAAAHPHIICAGIQLVNWQGAGWCWPVEQEHSAKQNTEWPERDATAQAVGSGAPS